MSYIDFNKYWLRLNEAEEAQTGKNTKNPKDKYEYKKEGDKYFFKAPGAANWTPAVKDSAIAAIKDQVTFTAGTAAEGTVIGKSKDPNYEFKMVGDKYFYKGKDDKDFVEAKEPLSINFIKANATFEEPVKGATTSPEVTVTGEKKDAATSTAAKVDPATVVKNITDADGTNLGSLKTISSTALTQSESITSVDDLRKISDALSTKLGVTKSASETAEGIKAYIKSLSDMISATKATTAKDLTTYLAQNFKETNPTKAATSTATTGAATTAKEPSAQDKAKTLKQEVKGLRQEVRAEKKVNRLEKKKERLEGKLANESVVWNFDQFVKRR